MLPQVAVNLKLLVDDPIRILEAVLAVIDQKALLMVVGLISPFSCILS